MVWEAYHFRGSHVLGVPENPSEDISQAAGVQPQLVCAQVFLFRGSRNHGSLMISPKNLGFLTIQKRYGNRCGQISYEEVRFCWGGQC